MFSLVLCLFYLHQNIGLATASLLQTYSISLRSPSYALLPQYAKYFQNQTRAHCVHIGVYLNFSWKKSQQLRGHTLYQLLVTAAVENYDMKESTLP